MVGFLNLCGSWILSFILGIVTSFYLYVKWLYRYFDKRGLPYDVPTFPFGSFASEFMMKKSYSDTLANIYERHKDLKIVGFFSLWTKQFLIRDHELLKTIMVKDFHIFQDRGMYYNKEKDPVSAHLFSLDGEAWKTLRAKLTPTFTSGKLKRMHDTILSCANVLVSVMEKQCSTNAVDCHPLFMRFGYTVIGQIAFGIESDCLLNERSEFTRSIGAMTKSSFGRLVAMFLVLNRQVAKALQVRVIPKVTSNFLLRLMRETIAYREKNSVLRNDYLQLMIDLKNSNDTEPGAKLTIEEIAAQAFIFIVGGAETSAATISFCLYELSRHPEIKVRLQQEIDDLPDLSNESIASCVYLEMVVNETLRKHPPVGFLNRECSQDYKVPGTDIVIEKGTQIVVSTQGMQNDPELYPDPELFNPERFSKENKDLIKPFTFLPFGDGPRHCIGNRFAKRIVSAALVVILQRFNVTLEDGMKTPLKINPKTIIRTAHDGMWLRFEDRSQIKA